MSDSLVEESSATDSQYLESKNQTSQFDMFGNEFNIYTDKRVDLISESSYEEENDDFKIESEVIENKSDEESFGLDKKLNFKEKLFKNSKFNIVRDSYSEEIQDESSCATLEILKNERFNDSDDDSLPECGDFSAHSRSSVSTDLNVGSNTSETLLNEANDVLRCINIIDRNKLPTDVVIKKETRKFFVKTDPDEYHYVYRDLLCDSLSEFSPFDDILPKIHYETFYSDRDVIKGNYHRLVDEEHYTGEIAYLEFLSYLKVHDMDL